MAYQLDECNYYGNEIAVLIIFYVAECKYFFQGAVLVETPCMASLRGQRRHHPLPEKPEQRMASFKHVDDYISFAAIGVVGHDFK